MSGSRKRLKASTEEVIQWDVQGAISRELEALARSLGTLPPTSDTADFNFQTLSSDIKNHAPQLWGLLFKGLEKDEGNKIKTNEKLDNFLTFSIAAMAKWKNQRANRLSLFIGLYLVSKGCPSSVSLLFPIFILHNKGVTVTLVLAAGG